MKQTYPYIFFFNHSVIADSQFLMERHSCLMWSFFERIVLIYMMMVLYFMKMVLYNMKMELYYIKTVVYYMQTVLSYVMVLYYMNVLFMWWRFFKWCFVCYDTFLYDAAFYVIVLFYVMVIFYMMVLLIWWCFLCWSLWCSQSELLLFLKIEMNRYYLEILTSSKRIIGNFKIAGLTNTMNGILQ